jgi:hypothetical protein
MHGLSIRALTCNCGNVLRRNDTLQQCPGAKVIRSVFVHPTCTNSPLRPFWITSGLRPQTARRSGSNLNQYRYIYLSKWTGEHSSNGSRG